MEDVIEGLPSDVVEDLREAMREVARARGQRRRKRRRYPHNSDIAAAIRSLSGAQAVDPLEFPDAVREYLESRGFYTGLVSDERVWRVYESLVRKGEIRDYMGVMGRP